ncbi:MAG: hypothetical protein JWR50_4371 [Mucilaginibacter sp.]|nr:hypothetical protein [Mucilaginibacter sp.]
MVAFGLMFVMLTEASLPAITHDPSIIAPRSWWLICGYIVAGIYCVILHFFLRHRDRRARVESSGAGHTLISIPIGYWSIGYLYSPK